MDTEQANSQVSLKAVFILTACLSAYFGGPHYIPYWFGDDGLLPVLILLATLPIPVGIYFKQVNHPLGEIIIGILVIVGQYRLLLALMQ